MKLEIVLTNCPVAWRTYILYQLSAKGGKTLSFFFCTQGPHCVSNDFAGTLDVPVPVNGREITVNILPGQRMPHQPVWPSPQVQPT
jgi:hypothetical protein